MSALHHIAISSTAALLLSAPLFALPLINEFQPNPAGSDPADMDVELIGTPGVGFEGWLVSVEGDSGTYRGIVDRATAVSGVFDTDGILTVSIPDLENPTFTFILTSDFNGTIGTTDIDTDNDATADDMSAFGTIYDAVGIPDTTTDALYGTELGGVDMPYIGTEPELFFRDGYNQEPYVYDDFTPALYDLNNTELNISTFNEGPTTTFDAVNPTRYWLDLRITEIWPGQVSTDVTADWFEIANYGTRAWVSGVDDDLYYDDESADFSAADIIAGIRSIEPNGVAIVVIGVEADATEFAAAWNPAIDLNGIDIGYSDGAGLGGGGDAVNLWLGLPTAQNLPFETESYPDTSGDDAKSYDVELKAFSEVGNAAGAVASDALGGNLSDTPAIASPGVTAEGAGNVSSAVKAPNIIPAIYYILN